MNSFNKEGVSLLEELRSLETELHKGETRHNRNRIDALLHPEFVEFGQSGRQYTRADILNAFGTQDVLPAIHSRHFDLVVLAKGVALLTYVSAHVDAAGNLYRYALRSSIWVSTKVGWQMRFHQGTPTADAVFDQHGFVDS